jgi:neutral ceramidase
MIPLTWQAGAATRTLPVPLGTPMAGFGSREGGTVGTLRPLEANALYVACGQVGAVVLTLDLLSVDRAWVKALRQGLWQRLGIHPECVLVAASHTHSGPAGFRTHGNASESGYGDLRGLRRTLLGIAYDAAAEAKGAATEARITVGKGAAPAVAANRRDPALAASPDLTALWIWSTTGRPIGAVWHFACHPTVLSAANRLLSPDYPGEVRAHLRQRTRTDLPVLFLNGAAGDVSTRFTRRAPGLAELTRLAAILVTGFPMGGEPLPPKPITGHLRDVRLPSAPPLAPLMAESRLAVAQAALEQARRVGASEAEVRLCEVRVIGARKRVAAAGQAHPQTRLGALQVLSIGDWTMAGFPGELYAREGLSLRQQSRSPLVMAVGYAGDYLGYLPPADEQGGYEADSALVAPGAGERLVAEAIRIIGEVQGP